MTLDHEEIVTNVGVTGYGENYVRGVAVSTSLLLSETRWSLLSRLIDGPALDRADALFLDDMLVAIACPDPRIWPLKLSWLLGAYGDWWAAHGAVTAMLAECRMGPWACAAACTTVEAFAERWEQDPETFEDAIVEWPRPIVARRDVVWGFGVAGGRGRAADERLGMIATAARHHGREDRPYYRAAMRGAEALDRRIGLIPNAALAVASICLDLGMRRDQVEVVMYQVLGVQILGNAFESAQLKSPSLQHLPPTAVRYVGPAPRRSPRAGGQPG